MPGPADTTALPIAGPHIVVMGVSGCGKSSVAGALAATLQLPLVEGDDFHTPANRAKMSAGQPLTDEDRASWLDALAHELDARPAGAVLTCSALRARYRDRLRQGCASLWFVHLLVDRETALARVTSRAHQHFFGPTLVDTQFQTLESPCGEPGVVEVDATQPLASLVALVAARIRTPQESRS